MSITTCNVIKKHLKKSLSRVVKRPTAMQDKSWKKEGRKKREKTENIPVDKMLIDKVRSGWMGKYLALSHEAQT